MAPCSRLMLFLAIAGQGFSADISYIFKPSGTYIHRVIKSGEKTIRSVAVLTPTVASVDMGVMIFRPINKMMELEFGPLSEEVKSDVAAMISDALRKRGWEVDESTFSAQAVQNEEKLRNLVDYLRARHATLVPQLLNRPKDVSKGRYSLGKEVASLAASAPNDALIFVRSHVFGLYNNFMSLSISLVDSQSGEVLCFSQVRSYSARDREKRISLILKELRRVP